MTYTALEYNGRMDVPDGKAATRATPEKTCGAHAREGRARVRRARRGDRRLFRKKHVVLQVVLKKKGASSPLRFGVVAQCACVHFALSTCAQRKPARLPVPIY